MGTYDPRHEMNIKLNRKYVKIGAIVFAVIAAVLGVGFISIKAFYNKMVIKDNRSALDQIPRYDRNESDMERDINQNIAIFGVDIDEMRTDVIFVVNLNTETNEIKVIAVPRDTKVTWTEYQNQKMKELDKGYHDYCKITEMSAYGGIDNLRYFTVNTLEDIMGISIDHYAVINISAFRKIVDAMGGVEVNVPRRMEYNDSYQDLHIDLQPGLQLLNGEQAEGLVRWRHNEDYSEQYAEGDVGRIETQQLFMKALAQKVLSTTSPIDLLKIATVVYGDLKTDIQFSDLKTYLGYASQFSAGDIEFATLPGEAVREDKWYYILNQPKVDAFMQKILYNREVPIATEEAEEKTESTAEDEPIISEAPSRVPRNVEKDKEVEQEDTDERAIALPTQKPDEGQLPANQDQPESDADLAVENKEEQVPAVTTEASDEIQVPVISEVNGEGKNLSDLSGEDASSPSSSASDSTDYSLDEEALTPSQGEESSQESAQDTRNTVQ